jgi:hypothetical protein
MSADDAQSVPLRDRGIAAIFSGLAAAAYDSVAAGRILS